MRQPPMDRRALQHKIEWTPKSILGENDEMYPIDHVFISLGSTWSFNPMPFQQTTAGNWCMWYDPKYSTPLPEGKTFAVGDVINFVTAPIFPKKMIISAVTPYYDAQDGSLHHLWINLN